jgi:beta-barrel assembly-enhancing protease
MFRKIVNRYVILLILTVSFASLTSCSDSSSPWNFNLFTPADDVAFGQQLNDEIRSNPQEYPLLTNHSSVTYLNNMMNEILKSPDIEYQDQFEYNIQIINQDVINAFAAPGGYVYVYTGLLKFLDNEATLAAIIAHEVAHAERRHATQRITKAYGASVILGLLLGQNPSLMEEIASNLLTGLGLLYNSRQDEYEADEYSFKYLMATDWYPGATTFFFDKVKTDANPSKFEILLSTHPMPQDRIDAVEALILKNNLPAPTESNLFSQRYTQFKQTLP